MNCVQKGFPGWKSKMWGDVKSGDYYMHYASDDKATVWFEMFFNQDHTVCKPYFWACVNEILEVL